MLRTYFLLLLGVIAAAPAYAQESPFQQDPVEHYAGRFLTGV